MKAFKFRSAEQVPFALDIILKKRLYCSDWRTLNDPLEGQFSYSYRTLTQFSHQKVDNTDYFDDLAYEISDEKKRKKYAPFPSKQSPSCFGLIMHLDSQA